MPSGHFVLFSAMFYSLRPDSQWTTVGETPLSGIQSLQKIRTSACPGVTITTTRDGDSTSLSAPVSYTSNIALQTAENPTRSTRKSLSLIHQSTEAIIPAICNFIHY